MQKRMPLYALLVANVISNTGNRLTSLAVPWFVLETTGSVSKAGITGFFTILPVVLATFFGGPIIERTGYKRVSILSDLLSAVTVALIPLLHSTVGLSFWSLQVLVFLGAFLDAPGSTARAAIIPDLGREGEVPLERVNALSQILDRLTMLIGPLVGGVLVTLIGASNVLWVDAATFVISAVLIGVGIPAKLVAAPVSVEGGGFAGYLTDLTEGFRFMRRDRLVFTMIAVITFTNFLESPTPAVLLPAYAEQIVGSPTALGAIISAMGAGSLVGAALFAVVGHRLSRRITYLAAWVLIALMQLGLAQLPALPFMIALSALLGFASGPLNPIIETVLQERVPAEMRGRVFGMTRALAWMAMPLGPMIAGFTVEAVGLRYTYVAIAGLYLIISLAQLLNRDLGVMDQPPVGGAPQEAPREARG